MKPLASTQLMMTWLSMCSVDESTTSRQRTGYIAHTLFVLIVNVINIVGNLAYCLKFISIEFDGAIFAFMVVIGEFGVIYFMIVGILLRQQMDSIFTSLSTIYNRSK